MRASRRFVAGILVTLLALTSAPRARAQLLVVATPGEPPAVSQTELAYAAGAGIPVTWLSLRVTRGPVAVIAALPSDASADSGLDAWFSALEATASPSVLLPRGEGGCGAADGFAHVTWPRTAGVAASELDLQTTDDVAAALDEQGLALPAELPAAERYVVWSWPTASTPETTRTLRIVGGPAPLSLQPGLGFPVLVTSVTRGSVALPSERSNAELEVTFRAQERPASDYRDRLQEWLAARPEPLLETRARGPLFDWTIYDDALSVASLVSSYATRAGKERPSMDVATCARQLRALREPDAPSAAACEDASDASLALAAAGPELATLQRFAVSGASGFVPSDAIAGGMVSPPTLRAQRMDDSACEYRNQPPMTLPPRGAPISGSPDPPGTTTVVVEETVVVDDSGSTEMSCGGSPQPQPDDSYSGNDSCGSDTTSESEADSSDSCSGDSSGSTDSGPDSGCSSDTSSTDGSSESGCSSDTSSSSDASDPSCDGGSTEDSGYDGDTCTGAAAPGGERTEKARAGLARPSRARRPRRLKTSLWSMAFAATILPIRRRKRTVLARD